MPAPQALEWGLVDELCEKGGATNGARALAERAAAMPAATVRLVKEAINATAGALHGVAAFADADQSALTRSFGEGAAARDEFKRR